MVLSHLTSDRSGKLLLPSSQKTLAPSAGYFPPHPPAPPPRLPASPLPAFRSCPPSPANPRPTKSLLSAHRSVSFPNPPSGEILPHFARADTPPRPSPIRFSLPSPAKAGTSS